MAKALFTGGRKNRADHATLEALRIEYGITIVVHGKAKSGVDKDVDVWANKTGLEVRPHPVPQADWDNFGGIAGHMRNARMLRKELDGLDYVIAFPGGNGTRDMVQRAEEAGFEVIHATS